ncbi:MAG: hypothetical protein NVS3B5_01510 [Sphingomicrobium sp.]
MTIIDDTQTEIASEKPAKKTAKPKHGVAVHREPAASPNPVSIVERAIERGITGADLKEIMDLQERYEANQARKAFDIAMAQAQADMPLIVKNRLVNYPSQKSPTGYVTYKHEDLAEVIETIRPVLHKHGLAHRFRTSQNGDHVQVTCLITGHGHREETTLSSTRDISGGKNNLQEIASTVTYLERYTLKAALGLAASHDDDGRASEGGNSTITALQLKELEAMAQEVGADVDKACKALKINSLAEMPSKVFDRAKAKLEAMRTPL